MIPPESAPLRVSGHVYLRASGRGPVWYSKVRVHQPPELDARRPGCRKPRALPYRDERRRIGPAWTGRGAPPRGTFNRRGASAVLQQRLVAARHQAAAREVEAMTFAAAAERLLTHLETVKRVEDQTVSDYRAILQARPLPAFGDRQLAAIEPRDLAAYRDGLLAQGRLSARSVTRDLGLAHAVFRRAVADGLLDRNPAGAQAVERPRQTRDASRFAVMTPAQVRAVAPQLNQADAAMVMTGAFAGLRLGELVALRWSDVDADRLHVRRAHNGRREKAPKSGQARRVPLVPELRDALTALRAAHHPRRPDAHVFSADGQRPDGDAFRRRFYAALKAAGLAHLRTADPPLRVHDLRHTFGTLHDARRADPHRAGLDGPRLGHHHRALLPPRPRGRRRRPARARVRRGGVRRGLHELGAYRLGRGGRIDCMDGEARDMEPPERLALVLSFDTDDPTFARGFEVGALWADLRACNDQVEAVVHATNTEMVLRMAEALEREAVGEQLDGNWTRVIFTAPSPGAGPSP